MGRRRRSASSDGSSESSCYSTSESSLSSSNTCSSSQSRRERDNRVSLKVKCSVPTTNSQKRTKPTSSILEEYLSKQKNGTITSDEMNLLSKMVRQQKWFEPPTELFMSITGLKLEVKKGEEVLGELLIDGSPYYLIGKDATIVEIPTDHPTVSRVHCAIYFESNDKIFIVDLGSTSGTVLDGKELIPRQPAELLKDSVFQLAMSTREYYVRFPEAAVPTPIPTDEKKIENRRKKKKKAAKEALESIFSESEKNRRENNVEEFGLVSSSKNVEKSQRRISSLKVKSTSSRKTPDNITESLLTAATAVDVDNLRESKRKMEIVSSKPPNNSSLATETVIKSEEEEVVEKITVEDDIIQPMEEIRITKRITDLIRNKGWVSVDEIKKSDTSLSNITINHIKRFCDLEQTLKLRKDDEHDYSLFISDNCHSTPSNNNLINIHIDEGTELTFSCTPQEWKIHKKKGFIPVIDFLQLCSEDSIVINRSQLIVYINAGKASRDGIQFLSNPSNSEMIFTKGKDNRIRTRYVLQVVNPGTRETVFCR